MSITSTISASNRANPALVLVHGLGSAGTIWKSLIPALEKDFTVYSIDLPGHGEANGCYKDCSLLVNEGAKSFPRCQVGCRQLSSGFI